MEPKGDIALIGLAVMGQNLILNMNDHGYTVVAYNRTVAKVDELFRGPNLESRLETSLVQLPTRPNVGRPSG